MYAVMGATGKVGSAVAKRLLAQDASTLLPVREPIRARALVERGAQAVVADYDRTDALAAAFRRSRDGAFVMLPPLFDPTPGFPEALSRIDSLARALAAAQPSRIVALSTIGADARQPNLLNQLQLLEQRLSLLSLPVTFLRAAWFLDNAAFDLESARAAGRIDSYLQPLDRAIPMVAACDVGAVAADLLGDTWHGVRVVELEGPTRVAPVDIAAAFCSVLGRPVEAVAPPRASWAATFSAQGMRHPEARMQMLDGFNAGWIQFADNGARARRGTTTLHTVIEQLTVMPA